MTEASFVPDISHTVHRFSLPSPGSVEARGTQIGLSTEARAAPSAPPHRLPGGSPQAWSCSGSEIPRPIIPPLLSPCHEDNKYRLIFGVNCFLFLTKLPPVCGGGAGRASRPTPSAPLPPPLLTGRSIFPLSSRVAPRTPKAGSQKPQPTYLTQSPPTKE